MPGGWSDNVKVKDGQFASSPWFREGHDGLFDGTYAALVMLSRSPNEPPNVQATLGRTAGDLAQRVAGPLVRIDKTGYPQVSYTRFFNVGSNAIGQ